MNPDRAAELEFASRWATGWLHGARRLASVAARPAGILLLDSSHGQDAEEVYTQALDLAPPRQALGTVQVEAEEPVAPQAPHLVAQHGSRRFVVLGRRRQPYPEC